MPKPTLSQHGHWTGAWCLSVLLFSLTAASATVPPPSRINGGMFYHIGLARLSTANGNVRGLATGLGGRLAFCLRRYVRVGAMGFGSGFDYASSFARSGSYVNLRGGGITGECVIVLSRLARVSIGVLGGGAAVENLRIIDDYGTTKLVTYEKRGTFLASPLLLFELIVGRAYSLSLLGSWYVGDNIGTGNSYGACLHLGVLFNR